MAKSPESFTISIKYGLDLISVEVDPSWTVKDLNQYIWNECGVPVDKQKLIHKAAIFNDPDATLESLKVKAKTKLMLVGAAVITDENQKKILEEVSEKFKQLNSQYTELKERIDEGIEKGFLPKSHQSSASVGHLKSVRSLCEQGMGLIDRLDKMQVSPKDKVFKEEKKSIVAKIAAFLDRVGESISKLDPQTQTS